jgi:hypothetical protein
LAGFLGRLTGSCAASERGVKASYKGRLDFGIDGPLTGNTDVSLEFGSQATPEKSKAITADVQLGNAQESLPYFIRNSVTQATASEKAAAPTTVCHSGVCLPLHCASIAYPSHIMFIHL